MTTTIKDSSTTESTSYDKIPYNSYPFEFCAPELLRSRGVLFGLNPPELKTARVLELGCAAGGSILRFAETYPESYTLGIDLSEIQIEAGKNKIKQLGLKNIELKTMSIADFDESYGIFDYIICHGVYSWVPEFVKEKILAISKQFLSKDGIAMISYTTLPGWNMTGTVREMMSYHSKNFQNDHEKVLQAKLALAFINESLAENTDPYANFMRDAAVEISDKEESYILHEYLIGENNGYYFHEFVKDARSHGLEYLAETDLPRMYIGNLPPSIQEKLRAIKDIVELEQYLDFINNTQFRSTILCHQEATIARNITPETLKKFYITSNFSTDEPESKDTYTNEKPLKFYPRKAEKTSHILTSSPSFKAVVYTFINNVGNPLKIEEIVEIASKKVPHISKEHIETEFINALGQLLFLGHLQIFAEKPIFKYEISEKPKVSLLAAFQEEVHGPSGKYWITSQVNSIIGFEEYAKHVIKLLDGKHDLKQLQSEVFQKLKDGAITAKRDGTAISDEKTLQDLANFILMNILEILRVNFGLVG